MLEATIFEFRVSIFDDRASSIESPDLVGEHSVGGRQTARTAGHHGRDPAGISSDKHDENSCRRKSKVS